MKSIDLYYKPFKGTTLADLYRDKLLEALKTRGYKCSDDELLNIVDYKTEQLMLLFEAERSKELVWAGVLFEAVKYLLAPKLDEAVRELNKTGIHQTFEDVNFFLGIYVEKALLKDPKTFYPEETSLGSVHTSELLKSLALLASWVPEKNATNEHRKLRAELLTKSQKLADKVAAIFQNKRRNTKATRQEYQDFKHYCMDLMFMRPNERLRK